jgi:hypothetical protein
MDSNSEKYKQEAKAFTDALSRVFDPYSTGICGTQVITSNYKLIKRIMADFEEIEKNGCSDVALFCKNVKKLAELTARVPGLTLQSHSLFRFHNFLVKEGGFFKKDKEQGSHGIPCMNMRTGLIYIS